MRAAVWFLKCSFIPNVDITVLRLQLLCMPLAGLQAVLPQYLRERFVVAALSYITCNSEGELLCRDNDCWCQCGFNYPQCNCPETDIQSMEDSLLQIQEIWQSHNQQFRESGEMGKHEFSNIEFRIFHTLILHFSYSAINNASNIFSNIFSNNHNSFQFQKIVCFQHA